MATVMTANEATDRAVQGPPERRLTFAFLAVGLAAMLVGFLLGPPQALNYAGINIYDYLPLASYYQGLTLHGVLMALVFTSYYICGLLLYLPARELNLRPRMVPAWVAFWMMTVGTVLAGAAMIANTSNVLYTLYPPMEGHFAFYLGLTLVVVATLIVAALTWDMRQTWKRLNPGQPTPLVTYMSLVTWIMWAIASLGLAAGALFLLLPWSLGLIDGVDPQLFRTLFWYTGHPIVYFWLLPAYVVWYAIVPRQAGGRLISDSMARLVFILFLLFSIPTGFHHQYADPGIDTSWKLVHNVMTAFIAIPSLITAFTIAASLENGGRARGGTGIMGWFWALPWGKPAFAASVLAMITFIFGGAGGMILASMNLNLVVHNTAFIPGHFHVTVGTAVTMTFMGVAFLLIPHLLGRRLGSPRAALMSAWLWFIGMMIMALGMHWQGILGVPRRSQVSDLTNDLQGVYASAELAGMFTGLSAVILLVAGIFFFYALIATFFQPRTSSDIGDIEFAECISGSHDAEGRPRRSVMLMERLGLWTIVAVVIIAIAYLPTILEQVVGYQAVPGLQLW